jgi:hypothetical protein
MGQVNCQKGSTVQMLIGNQYNLHQKMQEIPAQK